MTRTTAALLAAATLIGMSTQADAQAKFYAREKIVGMTNAQATAYVPPERCPSLIQYQWFGTNTGYVNIAKVTTLAAAQAACETEAAKGTPGVCGWTGDRKYGDYTNVYYHRSLAMQSLGSSAGTIYAVACK